MRHLTEKDITKFSAISGVPVVEIQKLFTIGALDDTVVTKILVQHDYNHIKKYGKFTKGQIMRAIGQEYQISTSAIQNAVYQKKKQREYVCKNCGSAMGKSEYSRNKGVCDGCKINEINQCL